MKRLLAAVLSAVFGLPLLALTALGAATSTPTAAVAGDDAAQVAAAPAWLRPYFVAAARRFVLPPALLAAVADIESGFNPDAVGIPIPGGPAEGMMQFLPNSWTLFNVVPGATPYDPGPAVLAAANHLLTSGRLDGGGWDAAQALYAYGGRSWDYVRTVLAKAATYGYRYDPNAPPLAATRYTFPMTPPGDYTDGHHDYPASDIFTPIGTPVVACVRAEVLRTSPTDTGLGGIVVTLRGEDGWRYYYAHLSLLDPTIKPGVVVEAGTQLGLSGNTGDARRTAPHLHFGISKTGSAAGQIDPYPYLRLWESSHRAPRG
jgi:murein DD-endopeptidase MepM/ murein hydrolase activator NlpD